MKITLPSVKIIDPPSNPYEQIEEAARICYQSHNLKDKDSAKKITAKLIRSGHHTPLEFVNFKINFIVDRGISHELVRHRHISACQESTRWCSYNKDKFDGQLTFILPNLIRKNLSTYFYNELYEKGTIGMSPIEIMDFKHMGAYATVWITTMQETEWAYLDMVNEQNIPAQEARAVLPNSLKTELQISVNLRELRYILELRSKPNCHPDMQHIMKELYRQFTYLYPELFFDININEELAN